jgi:flavin reductase (DIM6/NTAB) family NADH-FMN oxidoreductase RutF
MNVVSKAWAAPEDFRGALAALPAGVTVITSVGADGELAGATVSAFMSLSLEPPLVLVSLSATARTALAIRSAGAFCAHIVGARQTEAAMRFAAGGADKFAGLDHRPSLSGVPVLADFDVSLECSLAAEHAAGDHVLYVGLVERVNTTSKGEAVVWYDRRFHALQAPAQTA